MKTMNDVNEMRLEAAKRCGDLTRRSERWQAEGDAAAGIAMFANDILRTGTVVQYARDLEAWATLRERVEALRTAANDAKRAATTIHDQVLYAGDVTAFEKVLKIMDELEKQ